MTRQADPAQFSQARAVIPRGVAHFALPDPVEMREFAFLTLPRFTLLAFTSAIEPLRVANQLTQKPLYGWRVVSRDGEATESSAGIRVDADQGLEQVRRTTTVVVCSGVEAAEAADTNVLNWLRNHARHGGGIGALCTGAYTLARAGLLLDEPTTLHWENQAAFREMYDSEPLSQLFVLGRRHMSCAGGEAALDMMLALISKDHGPQLADSVAEMCLHSRRRDGTADQRPQFPPLMLRRHPDLARVVAAMQANLDAPLERQALSRIFGRSTRHLERTFKAVMGKTPKSYYLGLRLERARNLLSDTRFPLLEIALACGFESQSSFSKAFRLRYGVPPNAFRSVSS